MHLFGRVKVAGFRLVPAAVDFRARAELPLLALLKHAQPLANHRLGRWELTFSHLAADEFFESGWKTHLHGGILRRVTSAVKQAFRTSQTLK